MNIPGLRIVGDILRQRNIKSDVEVAKRFVLLSLPEEALVRLCQAYGCTPSSTVYESFTGEPKTIKLTKYSYANALAVNVSTEDLLRQIQDDIAKKELREQLALVRKKWKLDEFAEGREKA